MDFRSEVKDYLESTNTDIEFFSNRTCQSPNTVQNYLEGSQLAKRTLRKIENAMKRYPEGLFPPEPKIEFEPLVISRDACTRCGVRGELGCAHRKPLEIQNRMLP